MNDHKLSKSEDSEVSHDTARRLLREVAKLTTKEFRTVSLREYGEIIGFVCHQANFHENFAPLSLFVSILPRIKGLPSNIKSRYVKDYLLAIGMTYDPRTKSFKKCKKFKSGVISFGEHIKTRASSISQRSPSSTRASNRGNEKGESKETLAKRFYSESLSKKQNI